jgi:Ca-activated chloride channel family protein
MVRIPITTPRVLLTLSITLLACALPIPAPARQSAAQEPGPPKVHGPAELVVVPVAVKGPGGALVEDVRQEEFRVFEDDIEQRVSYFSAEASPLSVVLLIDDDMATKAIEAVQKSLVAMAGGFSESDQVAVAQFDAVYTPVLDFTADNDRLINELKGLKLGQGPARGLPTKRVDDAIYAAAEALRNTSRETRKVILLVSDGVDASNNKHTYDDTLKLLLSSDISVYGAGVDVSVLNRGKSLLTRYTQATGGDVFFSGRDGALSDFYTQVVEQARYRYAVGYLPTGTDRNKIYHTLEVRVRRPGLTVLTPDGYYLAPAQ